MGRLCEEDRECYDLTDLRCDDKGHSPRIPVSKHGKQISGHRADCIWRNGHKLCVGGRKSHAFNDLRHCELERVIGDSIRPASEDKQIDLPVSENAYESAPVQAFGT